MKRHWVYSWVMALWLTGCGGGGGGSDGSAGGERWVNTTSGTCDDAQIAETKANPEPFVPVGDLACQNHAAGAFAGEFRCAGSADDGTLTLQAKCSGGS